MTLSADLWADSADLAEQSLRSPLVQGVTDGSLPRAVFVGYVAQDAHFLLAFARAYALALAASPDTPTLLAFADLVTGVREELRLHEAYAARWGLIPEGVPPAPATLAYTDFLLTTAADGDLGTLCAAMTPCMRLYAHLGQTLAAERAPHGPYAEWVAAYADPDFEALAGALEGLLDRHATDRPVVRRAYRRAMELELGFFLAATGDT